MRVSAFIIVIAALLAPLASANALPPVRAGILQCQGGQNVGFVIGSVASFGCVFQSDGRRPDRRHSVAAVPARTRRSLSSPPSRLSRCRREEKGPRERAFFCWARAPTLCDRRQPLFTMASSIPNRITLT